MLNRNIFIALYCLFVLGACSDQALDPVVRPTAAPQLTSPAGNTDFVLVEAEADNNLTDFTWSAADFGYDAGINYALEIDAAGSDFANATTLGNTTELRFSDLSVGKINNILLAAALPANFANPMELRVCATVSDLVEPLCSDVISITITPYPAEVEYPVLGVPGQYQGWNETDTETVVYSRKSDDIYEGYIYVGVDMSPYKFVRGFSWDENWGDDEGDGILNPGGFGNDILIPGGAGMYFLRADLNTLEHTSIKTDWGVLGTATPTGTDEDTDFTYDEDNKLLTVNLDLTVGTVQFRANDSWDINFGDDFSNGTLEADGAAIAIDEAGNYTINLLLNQGDYKYELIKN